MPMTAFIGVRKSWLIVARKGSSPRWPPPPQPRLLGLVEQPRVLDRDHRLVGEGLEQRELLVGKGLGRLAQDVERADATVFPKHRRPGDEKLPIARPVGSRDRHAGTCSRRESRTVRRSWIARAVTG